MASQIPCIVDRVSDPTDFNVYLHPTKMAALGISNGMYVRIKSSSRRDVIACAKSLTMSASLSHIKMNRGFSINLNVSLGQIVVVEPFSKCVPADRVLLCPINDTVVGISGRLSEILSNLSLDIRSLAVQPGFILPVYTLNRVIEFKVMQCSPSDAVILGSVDNIVVGEKIKRSDRDIARFDSLCYDDIGGLSAQISRLRFLTEMPLLQSDTLDAFGIALSRGILITGPEGCGKTMIGKALENESPVYFEKIQGFDLLTKTAEEASYILRKIGERMLTKAPSILFIDDIDLVLADQQMSVNGDDADRRLSYATNALIDKIMMRNNVVVIATTKDITSVPQHLRSVNRLAHHIEIPAPGYEEKIEILRVMTRSMRISDATIETYAKRSDMLSGGNLRLLIDTEIMTRLSHVMHQHSPLTQALAVDEIKSMELGGKRKKAPGIVFSSGGQPSHWV